MKHGLARDGKKVPEYRSWIGMKERCYNQNHVKYHLYGGKGITVCPEWKNDFPAFLAYIGPKPSPSHSIDRIDSSRGYEPGNVRWADYATQNRNRSSVQRYLINGRYMSRVEAARFHGLSPEVVFGREKRGWTGARVFAPVVIGRPRQESV